MASEGFIIGRPEHERFEPQLDECNKVPTWQIFGRYAILPEFSLFDVVRKHHVELV
jgi:hypothetical protein